MHKTPGGALGHAGPLWRRLVNSLDTDSPPTYFAVTVLVAHYFRSLFFMLICLGMPRQSAREADDIVAITLLCVGSSRYSKTHWGDRVLTPRTIVDSIFGRCWPLLSPQRGMTDCSCFSVGVEQVAHRITRVYRIHYHLSVTSLGRDV